MNLHLMDGNHCWRFGLATLSCFHSVPCPVLALLQAIGGSGMLVYMSPSLALLSLVMIPPVAVVGMLYGRYVKQRQKAVQAALGKTMTVSGTGLMS